MKGARKYTKLFNKAEQHGRLYILPGCHARGHTFRIFVLSEGEQVKINVYNQPLNMNIVEVYGVISGNPGWSESYGWLHTGKWQEDFDVIVKQRKEEIKNRTKENSDAVKRINDLKRKGYLLY